MSGRKRPQHSQQCVKEFPDCLCNTCARDGALEDGTCCCAEKRASYRCGEFEKCPAFMPEDREETG